VSVTPAPELPLRGIAQRGSGDEPARREANGLRINGGFFVLRRDIFDYLRHGEDLVTEAFQQLLPDNQLLAYRYDGFWESMDTFKDKQRLDDLYARGDAPWELWKRAEAAPARVPLVWSAGSAAPSVPADARAAARGLSSGPLRVLCLGATRTISRSDAAQRCCASRPPFPGAEFTWIVLSGAGARAHEARRGAALFLGPPARAWWYKIPRRLLSLHRCEIKEYFEELKQGPRPT